MTRLTTAIASAIAPLLAMWADARRHHDAMQAQPANSGMGSFSVDFSETPWVEMINPEGTLLGQGASAVASVHDMNDPCMGRVVVKRITECIEEDVHNEIDMLTALAHPNIVKLYSYFPRRDFCSSSDFPYLLMEPALAGSISKVAWKFLGGWVGRFKGWFGGKKSRGESKAKLLSMAVVDTLRGLDYMHSKGVIHRDLKPANIWGILSGLDCIEKWECRFVLGDLELATKPRTQVLDNGAQVAFTTDVIGTKVYMPPEARFHKEHPTEQIDHKLFWTFKGDVFSLGLSLHEILLSWSKKQSSLLNTLRDSEQGWLTRVAEQRNIINSKKYLPAELKTLLWDMTHNDWRQRPTAAEALSRAEQMMLAVYEREMPTRDVISSECIGNCEAVLKSSESGNPDDERVRCPVGGGRQG